MRLVILTILLSLTLWSCGSRKVNRQKSLTKVELQQQKEVINDIQLQVVDKFVQRFSKSEIKFSAAEINITPDGSVNIKEPVVESKSDDQVIEVDSLINVSDHSKQKENAAQSILSDENSKDVDRKQFNWIWIIFSIAVLGVVFVLLKKYKLI